MSRWNSENADRINIDENYVSDTWENIKKLSPEIICLSLSPNAHLCFNESSKFLKIENSACVIKLSMFNQWAWRLANVSLMSKWGAVLIGREFSSDIWEINVGIMEF